MKKLIPIAFLLTVLTSSLPALNPAEGDSLKPKSRLTLDFVTSFSLPIGNYKANDESNEESGYAGNGFTAQVKLNWMGKRNFGLGISYLYQYNVLQDIAIDVTPPGTDTGFVLGDTPWQNHYLLVGPVFQKEIKRLVVDIAVLGGFVISQSTNFTMTVPVDSLSYRRSEGAGTGATVQVRAGVGYRISKRVTVFGSVSYLGATPTRKTSNYTLTYVEDPPESGIYRPEYVGYEEIRKKPVSTFNAGLGIIVKL